MVTIYPTNRKCYTGSIYKRRNLYAVRIRTEDYRNYVTFDTELEAFEMLKKINIEHILPIKNIILQYEDRLEVNLTRDQKGIFDVFDLNIVQQYIWHAHKPSGRETYYVKTLINKSQKFAHNVITGHIPGIMTVDHIDRNGLNNMRKNLEIVSKQVQVMNRGVQKNNDTGITGVHFNWSTKVYTATWYEGSRQKSKSFSINKYGHEKALENAIKYRETITSCIPAYVNGKRL